MLSGLCAYIKNGDSDGDGEDDVYSKKCMCLYFTLDFRFHLDLFNVFVGSTVKLNCSC